MAQNHFLIDWENTDSHIFINPRYSNEEKTRFQKLLNYAKDWPSHIWLSTSGSSAIKWVGLSKSAILTSAHSVNSHLNINATDNWVHVLPNYHVGGLGIWARSFLSKSKVFDYKAVFSKWNPFSFHQFFEEKKGTLTALVPTQLHDLVLAGLKGPNALKYVIIGGGALDEQLYQKANELGWRVLPSYGMTECASQVATACPSTLGRKEFPHLSLLNHLEAKHTEDGIIKLKGASLLSTYALFKENEIEFFDPKINGWLLTGDCGYINEGMIKIFGRKDRVIKIGGENVDFAKLEAILQKLKRKLNIPFDLALVAYPHDRLENVIHLCLEVEGQKEAHVIISAFNEEVLPFERIRNIHIVSEIPRNELSKLNKQELLNQINKSLSYRELI